MGKAAAQREVDVARAEFIAGRGDGIGGEPVVEDEISHEVDISGVEPGTVTDKSPRPQPAESGDVRQISPIRLLYKLAREHAKGLLVLEGRAGILKESHFEDGHPQFVSSNVASERLGEFLVREGAITPEALARALAVMPHFGGQLADTLVGLGLLRPLEAFRLLARQVSAKLVDVCTWTKGRYRWYPDREGPPGIHPLHLDALRIVGTGATALDVAFVDDWVASVSRALIIAEPATPADLDAFGLGPALERVHAMLDGRSTVADQLARVRSPDARTNFLRLLYLLTETELARLS
jgi:hypothetical protein